MNKLFRTDKKNHITTARLANFILSNDPWDEGLSVCDKFIIMLNGISRVYKSSHARYMKMHNVIFDNLGIGYNNNYDSGKFGHLHVVIATSEGELDLDPHPTNEVWLIDATGTVLHRVIFEDFLPIPESRMKYVHASVSVETPNIKSKKLRPRVISSAMYKKKPQMGDKPYKYYFRGHGRNMWLEITMDVKACSESDDPVIRKILSGAIENLDTDFRSRLDEADKESDGFRQYANLPNKDGFEVVGDDIIYQGISYSPSECMCEYCQID
jgi:hypothetical protein